MYPKPTGPGPNFRTPLSFHATLQGLLQDPPESFNSLHALVGTGCDFFHGKNPDVTRDGPSVPKTIQQLIHFKKKKRNMAIDPKRQVNINRNGSLMVLKFSGANSRSEHHVVFGKLTVPALPQNRPFKPEVLPNKKNLPERKGHCFQCRPFEIVTLDGLSHSSIPSFLHSFIHSLPGYFLMIILVFPCSKYSSICLHREEIVCLRCFHPWFLRWGMA